MSQAAPFQLISYIAPGAPATRRPADGTEPFLRPEIGFTPKWYRASLGVEFGEHWHRDPAYRAAGLARMREELARRFPGYGIGGGLADDILTGTYGACVVAAMFGLPILYAPDQWPTCAGPYLDDDAVDRIEPIDPSSNAFINALLVQCDAIAMQEGCVKGFINWQGILNNAHRLRGEALFLDLMLAPERCSRLFEAVYQTMVAAMRALHHRQRGYGVDVRFATVSNCLVNLVAPEQYREHLLPFDCRMGEAFGCIGIHNCAWTADPYLDAYAEVPYVAYIDMGLHSDLKRARQLFPKARRALMYTPTDLANKPFEDIKADLVRIAEEYGPCDLVAADIEAGTPDDRVKAVLDCCAEISAAMS